MVPTSSSQADGLTLLSIAPIVVSAFSIVLSIVFFLLNRQHTNSLFEAKQYPDLDFWLIPSDSGEVVVGKTFDTPVTCIEVECRNKTETRAIDLQAVITLTKGLKRVRWEDSEYDWDTVEPLGTADGHIGWAINRAIAALCPKSVVLCEGTYKSGAHKDWLEVRDGKKAPQLGLTIQFRWRPALWRGKMLRKALRRTLKPQLGEGNRIDSWVPELGTWLSLLSLTSWRPRTIRLKVEGHAE